jgi:hypothetical protein
METQKKSHNSTYKKRKKKKPSTQELTMEFRITTLISIKMMI